jgi:hypothetical protein
MPSALAMTEISGLYTRPVCSLSTLRSQGRPCTTQDSLPGGGPAFPGWILPPTGIVRTVSVSGYMMTSSVPELVLTHDPASAPRAVNRVSSQDRRQPDAENLSGGD